MSHEGSKHNETRKFFTRAIEHPEGAVVIHGQKEKTNTGFDFRIDFCNDREAGNAFMETLPHTEREFFSSVSQNLKETGNPHVTFKGDIAKHFVIIFHVFEHLNSHLRRFLNRKRVEGVFDLLLPKSGKDPQGLVFWMDPASGNTVNVFNSQEQLCGFINCIPDLLPAQRTYFTNEVRKSSLLSDSRENPQNIRGPIADVLCLGTELDDIFSDEEEWSKIIN